MCPGVVGWSSPRWVRGLTWPWGTTSGHLCAFSGAGQYPETTPWREGGPLEPAAVFRGSGGEKDPGAGSSPFINSPSWCGVSPHTLQRLGSPVSPERVRIDSYLAPGGQKGDGAGPLELPLTPTHISVRFVVLRAPRALASCRALGCIPLGFRSVNRLCAGPPHRWRRGPLLQLPLTHLLLTFHTFGVPVSHRLLSSPSSLCPPGFLRFRDLALKVRSWVRPAVLDLLHFRGEVSCESSQTRATVYRGLQQP